MRTQLRLSLLSAGFFLKGRGIHVFQVLYNSFLHINLGFYRYAEAPYQGGKHLAIILHVMSNSRNLDCELFLKLFGLVPHRG